MPYNEPKQGYVNRAPLAETVGARDELDKHVYDRGTVRPSSPDDAYRSMPEMQKSLSSAVLTLREEVEILRERLAPALMASKTEELKGAPPYPPAHCKIASEMGEVFVHIATIRAIVNDINLRLDF